MHFRWIIFTALIVLGQVISYYCNLLSGVLYVCDQATDDGLSNIELVIEPNGREVVYIHSGSGFRYLRIRAKFTGCRETPALYSEKYLIPGDLGLASDDSKYLLELSSDVVKGQHVYHVTRVKSNQHGLLDKTHKTFNDSISVATGLVCGHLHGYLLEAFGATLCTPYRPHHAQDSSDDHSLRVYADDTEDDREELPSLPPLETPVPQWKAFVPWLLVHYFSLRSWKSRAEGMALILTLGMYLLYLLFKSRRVVGIYTPTGEQERAERIGVYCPATTLEMNQTHHAARRMHQAQNAARIRDVVMSTRT